ncbi:MAG: YkgJ family cysteine cluster protein [bacterium]
MKNKFEIDCMSCKEQHRCCSSGAWVDLEEAKRIAGLGLKGEFFNLEKDGDFPSGYKVGTSYKDRPCTFLTEDGLCSIHVIDYGLKPSYCKEFPYEDGELSPHYEDLCVARK